MSKSDGVRVHDEEKSDRVRVYIKKSDGMRVDHEKE